MHSRPFPSKLIPAVLLMLLTVGCLSTPGYTVPTASYQPQAIQPTLAATSIPPTYTSEPAAIPTSQPIPTSSQTVPCFVSQPYPFAFLPASQAMLVRGTTGVQIVDLLSLQQVDFIPSPSSLNDPVVALSPDGKVLAWSLEDGTIQRVLLSDHSVLSESASGQVPPIKLEFSPDGKSLYSVSHDGTIKQWDETGHLQNVFTPNGELVNIGISPNGSLLAIIPFDGPVSLWKLDENTLDTQLGGSGGYDTSDAVFSPGGKYLAADLATGLFLWDLLDGTQVLGSDSAINSMAVSYSPDGRYLAYANLNEVFVSSPDASRTFLTLQGHQSPVFEVLFSPDSSLLISSDSLEVRVWRVADGRLFAIGKPTCP